MALSVSVITNSTSTSSRFLRKNMILGALWFSKDKPTMTTYLKPLMASINELSYEGKFAVFYACTVSMIAWVCSTDLILMDQGFFICREEDS